MFTCGINPAAEIDEHDKRADQNSIEEDVIIVTSDRNNLHNAFASSAKKLCVESIRLKLFRSNVHANARHEPTFNKFVELCTDCAFRKDKCKFKSVT